MGSVMDHMSKPRVETHHQYGQNPPFFTKGLFLFVTHFLHFVWSDIQGHCDGLLAVHFLPTWMELGLERGPWGALKEQPEQGTSGGGKSWQVEAIHGKSWYFSAFLKMLKNHWNFLSKGCAQSMPLLTFKKLQVQYVLVAAGSKQPLVWIIMNPNDCPHPT